MPQEVILLKLGEIALKGLNRRKAFEDALVQNIRRRMSAGGGVFRVLPAVHHLRGAQGRPVPTWTWRRSAAARSSAWWGWPGPGSAKRTWGSIQEKAGEYLEEALEEASTFKVECKRSDKKFPLKSPEISAQVGGYLLEKFPHLCV